MTVRHSSGDPASKPPASSRGRRTFLGRCLGLLSVAGLSGALYPVLRYLEPPPDIENAHRIELDRAEIPPGRGKLVIYRGRPALVVHGAEGFFAYSAVCTHLGCVVKWSVPDQIFECPCHGGKFNTKGRVIGGPPPGPLMAIPVRVHDDRITVGA